MEGIKPEKDTIRTEILDGPFRYRTMEEVELAVPSFQEWPHRHNYYVVIYVEKGEGKHHIDFKSLPLGEHVIYFVSPEQVHYLELKKLPKGHVLQFTPDFLQQHSIEPKMLLDMDLFFNCDEAPPINVPIKERAVLLGFISQIKEEYQAQEWEWLKATGALLKLFLVRCQRIKRSTFEKNKQRESRKSQIVRQFKKDLESYFKKKHKVSDYAAFQHLTSIYLNEVIKGETGQSVKEFIQNRITLEAKRLAIYSDWSMKEIAWELGFEDSAHFSRLFKKCQGETFSQFRARSVSKP